MVSEFGSYLHPLATAPVMLRNKLSQPSRAGELVSNSLLLTALVGGVVVAVALQDLCLCPTALQG